jgi:hypothetical protein
MIDGSSRYSHVGVIVISITREACLPVTDDYCGGTLSLGTFQDISLTNNIRARCEIVNAGLCSSTIEARSRLND